MFDQSLLPDGKTHRKSTFALAVAVQVLVIGLAIAIPMMYVEAMPMPTLSAMLVAPPPPPPPPAAPHAPRQVAPVVHKVFNASLYEPRIIPKTVAKIEDAPSAPQLTASVAGGVPGGVVGGQVGGVVGGILGAVPTKAPVPPPKPPEKKVIRVGGNVQAAKVISAPKPTYPFAAKEAHIQGTVRLMAVIGEDGHIQNLKAVSGSPLLVNAAVDAVKKWVYRPTYLNGQAVRVATEIDVQFQLSS
jgi:protein TonB